MTSLIEFTRKLSDPDEVQRLYAAEDIGYSNLTEAVAILLAHLAVEPSQRVRDAIAQALIRIDGEAPIAGAVALLSSECPAVRREALGILRAKGQAAVPFLHPPMQHGDQRLRKLVLDVLADLPSPSADDLYASALADEDLNVQITAVENLGRLRAQRFRPSIEALLEANKDPMLSAACLQALADIANPESLPFIHRRFPNLNSLPDFLLIPCLRVLEAVGVGNDFEPIGRLLSVSRPQVQDAALTALLGIAARTGSSPVHDDLLANLRRIILAGTAPRCQYQATQLLGLWLAREDVAAFLVECLNSEESLVRLAAGDALGGASPPLAATVQLQQENPPAPGC